MYRTSTTTMSYAQSQQGCPDCQFCRNCDPTPGRSPARPRDCRHHQTYTYIEPNTPAAANHMCPSRTAPASGRTTSGSQASYPQATPSVHSPQGQVAQYPQGYTTSPGYGNNPAGQYPNPQYGSHGYEPRSSRDDGHHDNADGRDVHEDIEAIGNARAHWGNNYANDTQNRRGATYRRIVVGGNTVTHSGDNIGYPDLETERLAKIPQLPRDQGRTDYRDRYNDQNGQ